MAQTSESFTGKTSGKPFPVVGIGASAGGLDAYKRFLKAIPENSGMAFILVQHLDPTHESMLPEILAKQTDLPVHEITDNIPLEANHIYILPSNKLLLATDGVLKLSPRPPKEALNRPIDYFFKSLAEVHENQAVGIVLSGTGTDGTLGLKAIKEAGGITFAQDQQSAAYEGMPQSAIDAGVADFIFSPEEMPTQLIQMNLPKHIGEVELTETLATPPKDEEIFNQILSLLRIHTQVDFKYYKKNTLRRRMARRIAINKLGDLSAYLNYLKDNRSELDLLFQDLLIPVTAFFRDTATFDALRNKVFPEIIKGKGSAEPLRIWVTACSTGEEAYSIAISLCEFLGDNASGIKIQLFATDISEKAIVAARRGIYTKTQLEGVSGSRLQQFFTKLDGHYQVQKMVRDMIVFASHNMLKDPPFAKMDLISCRNVLIYMEPFLQKKALATFHYSLKEKGFLVLGNSETTGGQGDLFKTIDKIEKIYLKKDVAGRFVQPAVERKRPEPKEAGKPSWKVEEIKLDFQKTADQILLQEYTPAGVVINEQLDIVHFRGDTGDYLMPSPGKPNLNLIKMAREGLGFELRSVIHRATTTNGPATKEGVPMQLNGIDRLVNIKVIPLPKTIDPFYLVLFQESVVLETKKLRQVTGREQNDVKDMRIVQLEAELAQAREDMRAITEEQEAFNEELQSANEELLSGSEELQSVNEELETTKEELQSGNEELTIVNQELQDRNELVNQTRKFSETIISTLHEPLLVLDINFRIKSANYSFYKIFHLTEEETLGKGLFELQDGWNVPGLRNQLGNFYKEKEKMIEVEINFTFPVIGERIICFNIQPIKRESGEQLILLALDDITERKKAEQQLQESEARSDKERRVLYNSFMSAPAGIAILKGPTHIYEFANTDYEKLVGKKITFGKTAKEIFPELEQQGILQLLDNVFSSGEPFISNELPLELDMEGDGILHKLVLNLVLQPMKDKNGATERLLAHIIDVTAQVTARKEIEASEKEQNKLATQLRFATDSAKVGIWSLDILSSKLDWSNFHKKMWGFDEHRENLNYEDWHKVIVPEDKELAFQRIEESKIHNSIYEVDYRINRENDGDIVWIKSIGQYHYDEFGVAHTLTGISIDITEQVKAKNLIEASEKRFSNILSQSLMAICILKGREMVIASANDAILEMWRKGKNVIGKPILEVLPEIKDQAFPKLLDDVYTTGVPFVTPEIKAILARDGKPEECYFNLIYQPYTEADNTITGVTILATEITEQVLARKLLLESGERYRFLADAVPEKVWSTDEKGKVNYFNQQWLHYTGINVKELNEWNWEKIIHPDDLDTHQKLWQHSIDTGEDFQLEHRFLRHDGEYRWHLSRSLAQRNENREIVMWVGTITDIHEQKILAEEKILLEFAEDFASYKSGEEFFSSLVSYLAKKTGMDYVFIGELTENFVPKNFSSDAEAQKLMVIKKETEVTITTLTLINHGKIEDNIEFPLANSPCEKVIQGDFCSFPKNCGMIFPKNDTGNQLKIEGYVGYPLVDVDGNAIGVVAVMHEKEITNHEYVSALLKIIARRAEFEMERIKFSKILSVNNLQLEISNRNLAQYAYVASHDLQEPLRKIITFARLVTDRSNDTLNEVSKNYLEKITRSALRMRELIHDLLAYSSIYETGDKFVRTDLNEILQNVTTDFELLIEEKGALIQNEGLPVVDAVPLQMHQLIQNLVSNALKFSRQGIQPFIHISHKILTQDEASQHANLKITFTYCEIVFKDNGIGFSPEYAEQIFVIFQRLNDRQKFPGTGIGLALCRKIAEYHGGVIYAQSEEGKGAAFHLILPFSAIE